MPNFAERYRFRNTWRVAAPPREVFTALARPADYPAWWPQVREARMIDDLHYWMLVRSFLPYSIAYVLTPEITIQGGLLQARVYGDIVVGSAGRSIQSSVRLFTREKCERSRLATVVTPFARLAVDANQRLYDARRSRGAECISRGEIVSFPSAPTRAPSVPVMRESRVIV